jgi:hypothetical protein
VAEVGTAGVAARAESRNGDGGGRNGHRPRGPVRRRPLPGGRAVVGGLLVAASAVGLFSVSTKAQGGPRETYVVARHEIAPGTRLTAADLTGLRMDLPAELAGRAFREPGTLVGATVIVPLAAGELVQASAVVDKASDPSSREITFAVPRATLAASMEEGERIDVVATYGTGVDAYSTVVVDQALIVSLDRGRDRVGAGDDAAVTVAIDSAVDAVALAHAVQLGRLTVVRATGATPVAAGAQQPFRQSAPTIPARP